MLALAGPASAHHGRHHHRHHHRHKYDSQHGPAGTIASFDQTTGKLTINLTEGETISGLVTEDTWIEFSDDSGHHHGWSGGNHHGWSGDDHHSWDGRDRQLCDHDWSDQASTDDLVPGATVDDALLVIADGKATFVKIDLAAPQTSSQQPDQPTGSS
jgi:hypothetical protein